MEKPSENVVKDCTINPHVNKTNFNYIMRALPKVSSEIHTSCLKYTKNNTILHYQKQMWTSVTEEFRHLILLSDLLIH